MKSNINRIDALILCGGQGLRLRSEIGETQKVMATVNERPFLDIILDYLKCQGFERVILCCGYKSENIEEYYKKNKFPLELYYSKELSPQGTGGAIKQAEHLIESRYFFVINGDSFCSLDYSAMLNFHQNKGASVSIAVSRKKDRGDYGSIDLSESGEIQQFSEKNSKGDKSSPDAGYVNAGVYCFDKEICNMMPQGRVFSLEKNFFPELVNKRFFGYEIIEDFIDIGTPDRLNDAKKKL